MFPFLPLFIAELGVGDLQQVEIWSGAEQLRPGDRAGGLLADLGRTMPTAWSAADGAARRVRRRADHWPDGPEPEHLAVLRLRMMQGAFTGVIAAVTALAISFVPRDRVGYALGIIQMSAFAATPSGPLLGGLVADHAGYG